MLARISKVGKTSQFRTISPSARLLDLYRNTATRPLSAARRLNDANTKAQFRFQPDLEQEAEINGQSKSQKRARSIANFVNSFKRGSSFLLYSILAVGAVGFTGVAAYFFVQELLMPSSDVVVFQRAFHLIEKDEQARSMLGQKLKAHGEATNNRWNHTRPIASRRTIDQMGREHLVMQFHVEGEKNSGLARLELIDKNGKFDFKYLVLDVPGHKRHYLINDQQKRKKGWFGIAWGPSQEQ